MENYKFKKYLSSVHNFSNYQFRLLREEVDKRVKTKRISNILETPKIDLRCAHCKSIDFILWGKRNDMQRYKCKDCNKTFNSLTNTPLARLRRKGHWLEYASCLKNEMTIRGAAKFCGIHKTTSFRWRHRFINNLKEIKAKSLGGIVETGELIMKESYKGQKKENYKKLKCRRDVFIVYGIDRNNNVFDITDKGFNVNVLNKEFEMKIKSDSLVYSEFNSVYSEFTKSNDLKHISIKANRKQHILSQINKLDIYKLEFKDWIIRHFRGVATKYLENYVSWFRSLNEFSSGINALTILYRAKSVEKYRHQPIKVTRLV